MEFGVSKTQKKVGKDNKRNKNRGTNRKQIIKW